LLIVVAIMGIVAGIAISSFEPSLHDQLRGAGEVVLSDLAYARSLAVANNSQYELTFSPVDRRYWLEHSGTNTSLDDLPESPYRDQADPPTRQTTDLRRLPSGVNLELVAVRNVSSSTEADATRVEFGTLGALTQAEDCWIWLAVGQGEARRYLPVILRATTGLATIGEYQVTGPSSLASESPVNGGAQVSAVPLIPGP
jgi:Tfp pilus assembly protein FimT